MMITLRIDYQTHLGPLSEIPGQVATQKDRLTFPNPAHQEGERRGYWTGNIPKEIIGYQVDGDRLIIPRGFTRQLNEILKNGDVQYHLEDRLRTLPTVDFTFRGELLDFQEVAVSAMATRDFGVLVAPTGSGKTVAALSLIARRRQPSLVVVHTRELLEQWIARIETFLDIPPREVGVIGGGKMVVGDQVSVALVQSLYKCAGLVAPFIGHLVVDECHRAPSRTFTEAVAAFYSRFMLGLSATPWRRDGLSRLIYWYLGDKVHEVDAVALVEAGHVLPADVVWRKTDFEPTFDPSTEYSKMLSELTRDASRNALIADDVAREAGNGGGVCLVLSDRVAHCKALVALLATRGVEADLLTGDLSNGERQAVVAALNGGKVKVLVATGQLIGEGFDCRELSTLFLATPIKFNGRFIQYLGRVLRPAPGKDKARVYDYRDPVGGAGSSGPCPATGIRVRNRLTTNNLGISMGEKPMSSRLSDIQREILLLCLERRFLTCQDILRQVFNGHQYETAHASLSRCLTRLWLRGLIEYWKTLTRYRTGITLTAEGEVLARTILAAERKE